MVAATLATGVAAGGLGVLLTLLLHAIQHLFWGYTENTFLIGVEHAGAARRILVLAAGGVVAGVAWWLSRRAFTTESVSVTHAMRAQRPDLPLVATIIDAVIQIVAVAFGASLGREGAPRQAGAAAGGPLGRWLGVSAAQQRILLAAGAGAGLAVVYNVPLGGAAFTIEVLRAPFAVRAIVPALVTSAIATTVGWAVFGTRPFYELPAISFSGQALAWALPLGVVAGVAGVVFVRLMTAARRHAPSGWRVAVAVPLVFTALGALAVAYPQLPGNGRGPATLAFDGSIGLGLAATLLVCKPLATAACLGAGAIGGTLTPALATGALLGAVAGHLADELWPGAPVVQFAVMAAAGVLAVTQHAPLTAVILTFELVGGTHLVLLAPVLVAVIAATAVAAALGQRGALADWLRRTVPTTRHRRGRPSRAALF